MLDAYQSTKNNGLLKSLPVLMYHYISNFPNPITVSPALFEEHCKKLAAKGWRGVSLAEAEAFLKDGLPLPAKSCLITFDDGYLDNYVYAWPILEKYGHCGVIFATCGRIEQACVLRPTIADVWNGNCRQDDISSVDIPIHKVNHADYEVRRDLFFSWEEARNMEKSGIIAIAGHSMLHDNVPTSPEYGNSFIKPGGQKRTFFYTDFPYIWGMPEFKKGSSLANVAFIPDSKLVNAVAGLVPQDEAGAWDFFEDSSKVQKLSALVQTFSENSSLGRHETPEEQSIRIKADFIACKNVLKTELEHNVRTFCWPWGRYTEKSLNLGLEAGFEIFFTVESGANPPKNPLHIKRFKAKDAPSGWLLNRIRLYSYPVLANIYAKTRKLTS